MDNKPLTNGLQSVHSLLQSDKKVLSRDNGLGKSRSCSWQYNSWENVTKRYKKYSTFLNTAELLPGSPRQIFIAIILDPSRVGSNAAIHQGQKAKFTLMSQTLDLHSRITPTQSIYRKASFSIPNLWNDTKQLSEGRFCEGEILLSLNPTC